LLSLLSSPLGLIKNLLKSGIGALGGIFKNFKNFLAPFIFGPAGVSAVLGNIASAFAVGGPIALALASIGASVADIYQWFNSTEEERNTRSDKMMKDYQVEFKKIQQDGLKYYFSLEGQINAFNLLLKTLTNPADFGNMITNAVVKGIYENDPRVKELEMSLENAKENKKIREAIEKLQNDIANDENYKDVKGLAQFLQKDVGESQK